MANEKQKQAGSEEQRSLARGGSRGIERAEVMSPFGLIGRMMEDMDQIFSGFGGAPRFGGMRFSPDVDVVQRDDKLVVRADLPGMKESEVSVELEDGGLVIRGERRHEEEREEGGVFHSERSYGAFHRRIPLPRGVDASSCDASFDNGVLEVTLALPEQGSKKIAVRSGAGEQRGGGKEGEQRGAGKEGEQRGGGKEGGSPPARH
jgi:HSP20 family protein